LEDGGWRMAKQNKWKATHKISNARHNPFNFRPAAHYARPMPILMGQIPARPLCVETT